MIQQKVKLKNKTADGYVISLGKVNLVFATTPNGMIGCGAFNSGT